MLLETLISGPSPTALSSYTEPCNCLLPLGKHPELMTSGPKGFVWPSVCGCSIWLCLGLLPNLSPAFTLSHLPTLSSFNPISNGANKWQQVGRPLVKPLYLLSLDPRAGYSVGQKTKGLELQPILRFLPPESEQTARALPNQRAGTAGSLTIPAVTV